MDPIDMIRQDRDEARRLGDTNADICFLATAGGDAGVSVRTLVLRDIEENRFTVFVNRSSPKWRALRESPNYELLLWYPAMKRQYRVSGSVEELDASIVTKNWHRRPEGSKYLDHVYETLGPQSSLIESRSTLVSAVNKVKEAWKDRDMQPPDNIGGVQLVAQRIEVLDLTRQDRIHDRRVFTLDGATWHARILVP